MLLLKIKDNPTWLSFYSFNNCKFCYWFKKIKRGVWESHHAPWP